MPSFIDIHVDLLELFRTQTHKELHALRPKT